MDSSSAASVPVKHLDDITECPICTEVFTDHRVLPCMHAFCLHCIEDWARRASPGLTVTCPQCRNKFNVPQEGVVALPKNFFIEKLLSVRKLCSVQAADKITACDVCSDEDSEEETVKSATVFCAECQQHFCVNCAKGHRKIKALISHKLVDLGGNLSPESVIKNISSSACDKHPNKDIEVYCVDCKVAICMLCYLNSHQSHKCSDIDSVAENFRKKIVGNISGASTGVGECHDILETLAHNEEKVGSQIEESRKKILAASAHMKRLLDIQTTQLMEELNSEQQKRKKEVQTTREEVEQHLMGLESFARYCEEVCGKGTACDIARAAGGLETRASELLKCNIGKLVNSSLRNVSFDFKPSDLLSTTSQDLLGSVAVEINTKGVVKCSSIMPEMTGIVSVGSPVLAVTAVGDDVYVIVDEDKPRIEVYSALTLRKQRSWEIPGLVYTAGLGSSVSKNSLYVVCESSCNKANVGLLGFAQQQNPLMARQRGVKKISAQRLDFYIAAVSLNNNSTPENVAPHQFGGMQQQQYAAQQFGRFMASSDGREAPPVVRILSLGHAEPVSIFVSSDEITLITSQNYSAYQLQVYSIDGARYTVNASLQTVGSPRQVLPLSNSEFVISFDADDASNMMLCIIDSNGQIVNKFDRRQTGAISLATDKLDNILVAYQSDSSKILVLDRTLRRSVELPLSSDTEEVPRNTGPSCLHLDEVHGRLYVGQQNLLVVYDDLIDLNCWQ